MYSKIASHPNEVLGWQATRQRGSKYSVFKAIWSFPKKAKKASRKEARAPQSRSSGISACAIARGSRMAAASLSRAASVTFVCHRCRRARSTTVQDRNTVDNITVSSASVLKMP